MKLLTKALLKQFAKIGSVENQGDPLVVCKFFTPDSSWPWFAMEYNPKTKIFFGMVHGFEKEMGYFSLKELETTTGKLGLPIERDLYFKQKPLSEIKVAS